MGRRRLCEKCKSYLFEREGEWFCENLKCDDKYEGFTTINLNKIANLRVKHYLPKANMYQGNNFDLVFPMGEAILDYDVNNHTIANLLPYFYCKDRYEEILKSDFHYELGGFTKKDKKGEVVEFEIKEIYLIHNL